MARGEVPQNPDGDGRDESGPPAASGAPPAGSPAVRRTGSGRWIPVETDRDPGLQPERTRLAWRRTTLSWAVAAVLAVRQVLRGTGGVLPLTAVSLVPLGFLAFIGLAHVRMQRLGAARPAALSPGAALAVAGCTVALAVCGVAVVW